MSYRTILVGTDAGAGSEARTEAAFSVAAVFGAHLTLLGFGIQSGIATLGYPEVSGVLIAEDIEAAQARARALRERDAGRVDRSGQSGDVRTEVAMLEAVPEIFGLHARYADLCILGSPHAAGASAEAAGMLTGALYQAGTPVLVCPEGLRAVGTGHVAIAWDGSQQALRAVRGALPMLARAERTSIILVDPEVRPGAHGEEPGADIALFLTRHGLKPEVERIAGSGRPVHAVLREAVRDRGAGLLVMGAWGHSQFREFVLGGPTRDMLMDVPVPLLMAH